MAELKGSTRTYLDRLFEPSTFQDLDQVLEWRRRWRAGEPEPADRRAQSHSEAPAGNGEDPAEAQARWQAQLDQLDEGFFEASQPELVAALQAIPIDRYPILRAPVQRRLKLAQSLDALHAAAADPELDESLWREFEGLLIEPPQDSAESKRKWLRRMRHTAARRQGMAFAKRLRHEHPEVFALESEWLQDTLRAKRIAADSKKPLGFLGCLGAYFLFRGILALVRYLTES